MENKRAQNPAKLADGQFARVMMWLQQPKTQRSITVTKRILNKNHPKYPRTPNQYVRSNNEHENKIA